MVKFEEKEASTAVGEVSTIVHSRLGRENVQIDMDKDSIM